MVTTTQVAFLYPTVLLAVVGISYIKWPQTMFYLRHWPFGEDADGLTETGEKTYYRLGVFFLLSSGGLMVLVLLL